MFGVAIRQDTRPKAVVYGFWEEVVVIEEDAERKPPLVIEAVL